MTVILDATLGGLDSNSYQTVADVDAYYMNSLNVLKWNALDSDTKAAALIYATTWMETITYGGNKCTEEQNLKWPRTGYMGRCGTATCDAIPDEILTGHAELALAVGINPDLLTGAPGTSPQRTYTQREKLDVLEIEYATLSDASQSLLVRTPLLFRQVPWLEPLVKCWMVNDGSDRMIRVFRG